MPLLLFDIDGTLTLSGQQIKDEMISTIEKLVGQDNIVLGLVGGGTLEKIRWQMREAIKYFKYIFAECGAIISVNQKVVSEKNMLDACDRNLLNNLIRKALHEISQMPIIYHGNPIDFRKHPRENEFFRRMLKKPDYNNEHKYKNELNKHVVTVEIQISDHDFYRHGWELSKTDIVSFGKYF